MTIIIFYVYYFHGLIRIGTSPNKGPSTAPSTCDSTTSATHNHPYRTSDHSSLNCHTTTPKIGHCITSNHHRMPAQQHHHSTNAQQQQQELKQQQFVEKISVQPLSKLYNSFNCYNSRWVFSVIIEYINICWYLSSA